jgi:hypothetical protein
MKLPRIVRQVGKRLVKASPILRRHIMSSSDHRAWEVFVTRLPGEAQ